jgi:hypothetical protein
VADAFDGFRGETAGGAGDGGVSGGVEAVEFQEFDASFEEVDLAFPELQLFAFGRQATVWDFRGSDGGESAGEAVPDKFGANGDFVTERHGLFRGSRFWISREDYGKEGRGAHVAGKRNRQNGEQARSEGRQTGSGQRRGVLGPPSTETSALEDLFSTAQTLRLGG